MLYNHTAHDKLSLGSGLVFIATSSVELYLCTLNKVFKILNIAKIVDEFDKEYIPLSGEDVGGPGRGGDGGTAYPSRQVSLRRGDVQQHAPGAGAGAE